VEESTWYLHEVFLHTLNILLPAFLRALYPILSLKNKTKFKKEFAASMNENIYFLFHHFKNPASND